MQARCAQLRGIKFSKKKSEIKLRLKSPGLPKRVPVASNPLMMIPLLSISNQGKKWEARKSSAVNAVSHFVFRINAKIITAAHRYSVIRYFNITKMFQNPFKIKTVAIGNRFYKIYDQKN